MSSGIRKRPYPNDLLFLSKVAHTHGRKLVLAFSWKLSWDCHLESSVVLSMHHSMRTVWASSHHGNLLQQQALSDIGSLLRSELRKWHIISTIFYWSSSHIVHQDSIVWDTDHNFCRRVVRKIMAALVYHRHQYLTCTIYSL